MSELVRLGREYSVLDPTGGIPGFLGWLTSALRGEDRSGGDAVEIVTFHAAKGLEWSVVHVAGLEEGFVPIHHAKDSPDDLDEERRLLYVALTRARDELICSWAKTRTFGSRTANRQPSPSDRHMRDRRGVFMVGTSQQYSMRFLDLPNLSLVHRE